MYVLWDLHGMTQPVRDYVTADPINAVVMLTAALLVVCALYCLYQVETMKRIHRQKVRFYWRGMPMTARREVEMISDAITDALEDLYYKEKITKKQRDRWYARFASQHALTDLVPRRKKVCKSRANWLKEQIKYRLTQLRLMPVPKLPDGDLVVITGDKAKRRALGKQKK
jgi:hypothetical protein